MTTVRTIDSHASTTAACSSSKEVAEWTNVWAIHSMPVETIATGWATTAEVVAAAVPTMTISRASEDASKLGISHRYATNSLFRTTSTWQDKRVLTWLFLSRCSPSTFYWSRRYVVPLEGTDYVLFFSSWQQTFWRKPTSHPRYNEVNCIDLRRVSPRIIVTQLLHTYSLRTLFYTLWDSTHFWKDSFVKNQRYKAIFYERAGFISKRLKSGFLGTICRYTTVANTFKKSARPPAGAAVWHGSHFSKQQTHIQHTNHRNNWIKIKRNLLCHLICETNRDNCYGSNSNYHILKQKQKIFAAEKRQQNTLKKSL